ncbi:hormogonium polysaccharide biosynthesis glycosyltransferase HpsE [Stenomitos frigidus]|uniref:Glycosyltransferase family 2 protein n=1 Tax=Stenomitos frigidus ULC18 TaxID=2107698 RepID=A0A2T1EEA7_9CYAN|nr:hormogonium polysaccharide biosynthesis glycosyltransferase HpsE [Stenomitos frigidus]PSB31089.1 glycosyltransferase family 2 protein [Stenomitos frigidus ULC18]
MSIDFTVAIRTYNAEKRLPEVLDRLLAQVDTEGIRWEVLVVDNNSTDQTAAVVAEYAQQWRSDSQLRCVSEPKQGSAFARDRAMQDAASESLVGFLDDDNFPAENWVAEAYRFGLAHPQAGAYGSNIYAKLDAPPPPEFHQIKFLLAVEERGAVPFRYTTRGMAPNGPGCVIRKQAWQEAVPKNRRLKGRDETWKVMIANAEDIEIMLYIQSSQWEVWHNPGMEVWHHLPPKRFERSYLLRLAQSGGLAAHSCRYAKLQPWQRPLMPLFTPLYVLLSGWRVGVYYLQNRHDLATDLAKACLFQYQWNVLLSSFQTPRVSASKD